MTSFSPTNSLILNNFKEDSVAFIPSLFQPDFCKEVCSYILDRENDIIKAYSSDRRGLVCESVNGSLKVKYFEYPFHYDALYFGRFLNSRVFELASFLLDSDVRFVSAEIHSRFPNASSIPPHQDNAYYGLSDGKGITFYVALNSQTPENGGLQYYRNSIANEFSHKASSASGFSLELADQSILADLCLFSPKYSVGDCSVHHSRSIHFANPVPSTSERSFVFRFSFYSIHSSKLSGHDQKYKQAIASNRDLFN